MPVDEDNLDKLYQDAVKKMQTHGEERRVLRSLLQDLEAIRQVEVRDPTADEPRKMKKEMPKDRVLGTIITTNRRQSIYDKCVADAAALGI